MRPHRIYAKLYNRAQYKYICCQRQKQNNYIIESRVHSTYILLGYELNLQYR
jgi:hypothetical protein